ncbi:MAG: DUF3865 domain-containing protein [Methanobacterium sp.]|nr:DUF3865 domain-containing protein [Methanobacterium sp.]
MRAVRFLDAARSWSVHDIRFSEEVIVLDENMTTPNRTFRELSDVSRAVASNHLLIDWSENSEQWSFHQYSIYVSNMAFRLGPTVARLRLGLELLKNNFESDFQELIDAFEHNISDEAGNGDAKKSHAHLFLKSSRTYSVGVYGFEFQRTSPLDTTATLHAESMKIFSSNPYVMLGATVAQETHALPQLEHMFKGASRKRDIFSDEQWHDVSHFYDVHLDGTELRHAEDLNDIVWSLLNTREKENKFNDGFDSFIELQSGYWAGLASAVLDRKP